MLTYPVKKIVKGRLTHAKECKMARKKKTAGADNKPKSDRDRTMIFVQPGRPVTLVDRKPGETHTDAIARFNAAWD